MWHIINHLMSWNINGLGWHLCGKDKLQNFKDNAERINNQQRRRTSLHWVRNYFAYHHLLPFNIISLINIQLGHTKMPKHYLPQQRITGNCMSNKFLNTYSERDFIFHLFNVLLNCYYINDIMVSILLNRWQSNNVNSIIIWFEWMYFT